MGWRAAADDDDHEATDRGRRNDGPKGISEVARPTSVTRRFLLGPTADRDRT